MPLTPDSSLELLFPSSFLSRPTTLHPTLHLRPLATSDDARSHILTLATLTVAPLLSPEEYAALIGRLQACPETYYPVVVVSEEDDQILGCATLIMEQKFLRGGGKVGHIEDVAVRKEAQGKGLGKILIQALLGLADKLGAYKVILDCSQDNIPFYEKCGLKHKEYEMVKYFERSDAAPAAAVAPRPTPTATAAPPVPGDMAKPANL